MKRIGIDVGSTTVKLVTIDESGKESGNLLFSTQCYDKRDFAFDACRKLVAKAIKMNL
jgi:activator of 2-hydroxyglutaryl-CoA dehydratase